MLNGVPGSVLVVVSSVTEPSTFGSERRSSVRVPRRLHIRVTQCQVPLLKEPRCKCMLVVNVSFLDRSHYFSFK
jgi:hypothetical protein